MYTLWNKWENIKGGQDIGVRGQMSHKFNYSIDQLQFSKCQKS